MGIEEEDSLISVIVAVFNGAKTLQHCIDSVAEQTYPHKELIIIDGGSTDGTVDILKRNNEKIGYWESKPDRGIYHAWNKALDHARGKWICFLGADDYFSHPQIMEKLIRAGNGKGVDLVCGQLALVDEAGKILRIIGKPWNWEQMKRWQTIAHSGMMHHRKLFEIYGKFNEKYKIAGDYEFLLRLGARAKAAFIDDIVVYMGNLGTSRVNSSEAHTENRLIQASHTEIGSYNAGYNYFIARTKTGIKNFLCIKC